MTEKTLEDYTEVFFSFSPKFMEKVRDKGREVTDGALVLLGDPKEYADYRTLTKTAVESTLTYLVAEGFVTLAEEWVATEEEKQQAKEQGEKRRLNLQKAESIAPGLGNYL